MTDLPFSLWLTVGSPYDAAVQLIYKLPAKYRLVRHTHHTDIVEGSNLPYRDLVCPSRGTSEVKFRASTHDDYEAELIQTTLINLRTWNGQTATKIEKRAFRIRNGGWSLWAVQAVDGVDVVRWKLADLTLCEVASPAQVGPTGQDVVQKAALKGGPWQDGRGTNAVAMCVWVGRKTCWQLSHQIDREVLGASEISNDEFWPAEEGGGSA